MIKYTLHANSDYGKCEYVKGAVQFISQSDLTDAKWKLEVCFEYWEEDAYIFSPACLYNGNRFPRNGRCWYSPCYMNDEMGENAKEYINNIPALNEDGSGIVEVTAGDMATPCVAVYFKQAKKATFIFFEQAVKGKNIGVNIQKQKITLQYPSDRNNQYRMREYKGEFSGICTVQNEGQEGGVSVYKGEQVSSQIIIQDIDCQGLPQFFAHFFENRKILLAGERAKTKYTKSLWETMENHFNNDNWSGEYYGGIDKAWQSGWFSGIMTAYAFNKLGNLLSKERAEKTLDFIPNAVSPTGLFYSKIVNGKIENDRDSASSKKGYENMRNAHLVRRSGEMLYFLIKHLQAKKPKEKLVNIAKNCADEFVRLFDKYKTFGQYVNIETGEMLISLSTCGAIVVAGLVKAYEYFNEQKYLQTAIKAGQYYYDNFVQKGYTNGGPSDVLCAPDSESAYGALECFVCLYEATKDKKWLDCACDSAHIFSSWVMSYKYEWVTDCEFKKQNINTVGSVFASVQNKHSAPGICTSSGDALYRLYKYTGEKGYLQLLKDIVYFIPQCVSTEEKPLYAKNFVHGDERGRLKNGYICERVNTSDWEGMDWIGNVWLGSCWCEVSLVLTFAELMDIEEMED